MSYASNEMSITNIDISIENQKYIRFKDLEESLCKFKLHTFIINYNSKHMISISFSNSGNFVNFKIICVLKKIFFRTA